jgi:hypothetical protein
MLKSILTLILLVIMNVSAQAYFKDIGVGVRPMGMGGAYTAVADDGNAVMWNVAGLGQLKKHELMLAYTSMYVGLEPTLYNSETDSLGYHFISYVSPLGSGGVGLSWVTFQSSFYDENTICLSYGKKLIRNLYTGINLKRAGWSIEGNGYTKLDSDIPDEGTSKNGFTIDLGFLIKPAGNFSFGFFAENLLPIDVGLNEKERISANLRSGVAYRINAAENLKLLLLLDTTYRKRDHILDARIGSECWFLHETAGVRLGLNPNSATSGLSYRITLAKLVLQIDYAFIYPLSIQETFGSHRVSLCFRI